MPTPPATDAALSKFHSITQQTRPPLNYSIAGINLRLFVLHVTASSDAQQ
jgi:hypothetical protein